MPDFIYNEETRQHTLDGKPIVSVTQLLQEAGLSDYSMVPAHLLEAARNWGLAVHRMVELWLKNDLNEDTLDVELFTSLYALKQWIAIDSPVHFEEAHFEVPSYHKRLGYCGKPDIVFPDLIIDVKSREPSYPEDEIQLILYDKMDNGDREHRILSLFPDGKYLYQKVNATKAKRAESWRRARYLIDLHNRKQEVLRWKK